VHPPALLMMRGHERRLGGGERDVEVSDGVSAVDAQRPGDADRQLDGADVVLDVALISVRVRQGRIVEHQAPGLRRRRQRAPARTGRLGHRGRGVGDRGCLFRLVIAPRSAPRRMGAVESGHELDRRAGHVHLR